jgi:hypothetical protein
VGKTTTTTTTTEEKKEKKKKSNEPASQNNAQSYDARFSYAAFRPIYRLSLQ